LHLVEDEVCFVSTFSSFFSIVFTSFFVVSVSTDSTLFSFSFFLVATFSLFSFVNVTSFVVVTTLSFGFKFSFDLIIIVTVSSFVTFGFG
jgi:hypothetical protein